MAITTFFGIQTGVLARTVRLYPVATLVVIVLVGLGVVISLIAPAVGGHNGIPLAGLLLVLLTILLISYIVSPDLPGPDPGTPPFLGLGLVAGIATILVRAIFRRRADATNTKPPIIVPWLLCLVSFGVVAVACGVFIAAKLSILDKLRLESAAVVSNVSIVDGVTTLQLSIAGSEIPGPARVRVLGTKRDTPSDEVQISEQVLMPGRGGAIDARASVPIAPSQWVQMRVLTCQEYNTSQSVKCNPIYEQSSFTFEPPSPALSGVIKTADDNKRLQFLVDGSNQTPGSSVRITVRNRRGGPAMIMGTLGVKSDGSGKWEGNTAIGGPATWTIEAATCGPDDTVEVCEKKRPTALAELQVTK